MICTQPIYFNVEQFDHLPTNKQTNRPLFMSRYTLVVLSLLTILTSNHNQSRGVGWRADNTNGIPGSHSELIALICCQTTDSVLAVVHVGQVGFEPAAMSLAFLNGVASNLATSITFWWIPFKTY